MVTFLVATGVGFWFGPEVDAKHPADRLNDWFIAVLSLLVVLAVGLLLFQRGERPTAVLRFLNGWTVLLSILGIAAPAIGLLPLHDAIYRYLFAVSLGALMGILVTVALVGIANLNGQRHGETADLQARVEKAQHDAKTDRDKG